MRNEQAQKGVDRLRAQVDSLIVINNNKLREVYGNLGFKAGFSKADEVLATAARGIAEVITHHYTQNIDLRDAKTVLSQSGTAIMGSSTATGSNRAFEAITKALDSPLLNDNKITGAKNVLLLIVSGGDEITIDEIGEINDHIQAEAGNSANIIMGVGEDEILGEAISVTIIATGFDAEQQNNIVNVETKKIIHTLEEEQKAEHNLMETTAPAMILEDETLEQEIGQTQEKIVHTLEMEEEVSPVAVEEVEQDEEIIETTTILRELPVDFEEVLPVSSEEFEIYETPTVQNIEEEEPEETLSQDDAMLSFDMPLLEGTDLFVPKIEVQVEEAPASVLFHLDEDIEEIEVKEPIEIIPVTELSEEGEKRYSLDDYIEPSNVVQEESASEETEQEDEETMFETRTIPALPDDEVADDEVDPMNSPISKLLIDRAADRKRKMKEFNYKFHHNQARIEDIEKQPAYKRMGIDLEETPDKEGTLSRTSLSADENDEIQLRNNNSFLHDNVD